MTTYTDVFTGSTIYPAEVSFQTFDLTGNITLLWPQEAQPNQPVVSSIMQIDSATADNQVITLPDARSASTGETILFNNLSAHPVNVNDGGGSLLIALPAATQWTLYLEDNTTAAGGWKSYQAGAATSTANAGALVGSGLTTSGSTLATNVPTTNFANSFTLATADRAKFYNWTGTGAGVTVTLPDAATVGAGWYFLLRNSGDNSISLNRAGGNTIDGLTSLTFQPGFSATVVSDGSNFFTVGLGQNVDFFFDYVVVDVTGSTDYTLSGSELNKIAYEFIGVLGADINIIVPATVQQYWVYDNTTAGAFTTAIATADQASSRTPLALIRGDRVITYCNGTDVVATQAASVSGTVNGGTF